MAKEQEGDELHRTIPIGYPPAVTSELTMISLYLKVIALGTESYPADLTFRSLWRRKMVAQTLNVIT